LPLTVNLPGNGVQLNNDMVQSVVYRAYASVTDQSVEVPIETSHYFVGHFFSGKNGNGTDFGQASIDTRPLIFDYAGKASLVEVLQALFPPPFPE
jgi:hypothetical protein